MGRETKVSINGAANNPIDVVRYAELKPCYDAFIDTRTPGSDQKENFTIIGPGVSENPDQHVHIARPHGFNIGGARQPPGCTNSQHSHDTAEFFYVHSGTWSFDLGETGEDASIVLKPGDAISIPTQLFRGFENVGEDVGYLFAVLGGDDPGHVLWAPYVFDMAEEYGLVLLENGSLIDRLKGEAIPQGMAPMPRTTKEQVAALQRLDADALRNVCVISDEAVPGDTQDGVKRRLLVHPQGKLNWPHEFQIEEVSLAKGSSLKLASIDEAQVVFVQNGKVGLASGEMKEVLARGDTATIRPGAPRALENDGAEAAIVLIVTGTEPPVTP